MSSPSGLPLNQVIQGECIEAMASLPAGSIDVIFADPPYNLQLHQALWRPNQTRVDAVDDAWDQFADFQTYDRFTLSWLQACRRLLKPTGTIWVIGSYHNIYRVGTIMQDLGYWVLNDIVWVKRNPMPNFRGVRFTNAHESLIWAQKDRGASYTFNHHAMKALNDGLQMRSDWYLPICNGNERLTRNGEKAHPTQKPEALLYYVLQSSTRPGDVVLDPFFGTGTTGVVAARLHRHWIGIERQAEYADLARQRIAETPLQPYDPQRFITPDPRRERRIAFGLLVAYNMLQPGQILYFANQEDLTAQVLADGAIEYNGQRGSIHQVARIISQAPCNGWTLWFYRDPNTGEGFPVDRLRQQFRDQY